MITAIFFAVTVPTLIIAFILKSRFSGENYSTRSTIGSMLFNLVCGVFHMALTQSGCLLFYQCFPNIEDSHPVILWLSFFCILLHCLAIPSEWEPRRWFRKKNKSRL